MYVYIQTGIQIYFRGNITFEFFAKNLLLPNRCTIKHRFSYSRLRPNFKRQYIFINTKYKYGLDC